MNKGLVTGAVLCAVVGVAYADSWTHFGQFGTDHRVAVLADNGYPNQGYQERAVTGFGDYSVFADSGYGSMLQEFTFNASELHSLYSLDSTERGYDNENYFTWTLVDIAATETCGLTFANNFTWDVAASEVLLIGLLFDSTTQTRVVDVYDQIDPGGTGTAGFSYDITLEAGHVYRVVYGVEVRGLSGSGAGSGSGGFFPTAVPLPSASALAGLGLLGLGVRRRRGSL